MFKFNDLRISSKLILVFGLLIVLAGIISAVSYISLQKIILTNSLVYQLNQIDIKLTELPSHGKRFYVA